MRGPPRVTLFPYTTLFRSHGVAVRECAENLGDALDWRDAGGRSPLQRPRERDVPLMAGPKGHDIGVQPSAEERQVSEKVRSEEHTSELQSLRHLVCRLLLE